MDIDFEFRRDEEGWRLYDKISGRQTITHD